MIELKKQPHSMKIECGYILVHFLINSAYVNMAGFILLQMTKFRKIN